MSFDRIIGIAGLALSLVGIPLAFLLARRGRKRPVLRYRVDFGIVVDSKDGDLVLGLLRGPDETAVARISRTVVAVWNHQGDTVSREDISARDPLKFEFGENDRVIRARLVTCSREANQLKVSAEVGDLSAAVVDFDFLDARDGGVIEFIHEGEKPPRLTGTVRGVQIARKRDASLSLPHLVKQSKSFLTRREAVGSWIMSTASVIAILAIVAFASSIVLLTRGHRDLVDPALFDLSTANGQKSYADAVTNSNISGIPYVAAPLFIFGLLLAIVSSVFVARYRMPIPRRIIAVSFRRSESNGVD